MIWSKIVKHVPSNNRLERIWKLAQVDFRSRYYNDRLGLLWALIKPIFEAILYYIAFKFILEITQENFGLFLFGGIIIWNAFSEATIKSIGLLRSKNYLIENVQFNHIDLYFSHALSTFFGLSFNLGAFAVISLIMGHIFTLDILLLPIILLSLYGLIIAFSQILSTLQPFIKDITHIWDMTILSGFWVSAIFFDPKLIFEKAMWFAYVNPFIGIILNIRGIFLNEYDISIFWLIHNFLFAALFLIIGNLIFKKYSGLALEKI